MERLQSLIAIPILLGLAWLLSSNRKNFPWRVVLWGTGLQIVFAIIILWTPWGRDLFSALGEGVTKFLGYTLEGSSFLFGNMVKQEYQETFGFQFAFAILPTIIFFGSFMGLLYHFGIVQRVVKALAWVMTRTMGTSGAESLSAAGNIFLGQTESPLLIRPFLKTVTRSEMNAIMVGGFATVAGGVMAGYILLGVPAKHLLAASVMAAPGALIFAKIFLPEREQPDTSGKLHMPEMPRQANVIDAAASGARDGLGLAVNVGAMLLAFIALIAVVNALLGLVAGWFAGVGMPWFPESLREIFSYVLWPIGFILGVPIAECKDFAYLIGTKISVNEFVAYVEMSNLMKEGVLSPRTIMLASYALCGFANFSSIGIQIGGIGSLAPERRKDLAELGLKAMIAGAMVSLQTAAIAGVLSAE
ncbi:MAG: NupC/NupG family nucleoside CNT transporter [Calditrichaeota bacterium]|nr:NupC/NupG family nucleoside CNT transporter [Calditrichota bacterium]MCB9391360.1 NupC/NupG family nucleoside CNT transporter [Calditrichota bacterium]